MNFGRTINIGKYCLSICLILLFADVVTAQKTDSTTTKAPSSASTKSAVKDAVSEMEEKHFYTEQLKFLTMRGP